MRLTRRQGLLVVVALDLAGFGLIVLGLQRSATMAFALASGVLLGLLVRVWRDL